MRNEIAKPTYIPQTALLSLEYCATKNDKQLKNAKKLLYPKYLLLQNFARKAQGLQDDEILLVKALGMWVIEVSLAHDCILGTATGATHGKFNSSY